MKYYCPKCYHIKDFVNDIPTLDEESECPICKTQMREIDKKSKQKTKGLWVNQEQFENGVQDFIDTIKKHGVSETWKLAVEKIPTAKVRVKSRFEYFEALTRLGKKFEIMD